MAELKQIGVIGGGTMGAGIVHALLAAGVSVTLVESSPETLQRARDRVTASLDAAADRGKLSAPAGELATRLIGSVDYADLSGVDLVIEAVPESPQLKAQVLKAIEAVVGADVVVATNTSSLSIDELAEPLAHPDRFVGMHFFNPVPASALVEVVRGSATSPAALSMAHRVTKLVGKESIEVRDSPGFATSRLGVLLGLEGIRMVEEAVGSPADIDQAMVLGYKHPMGPLRLTDLVGLDVRLGIAEYLHGKLGERFAPPALLRQMVADGKLGKKTGQGFYTWT